MEAANNNAKEKLLQITNKFLEEFHGDSAYQQVNLNSSLQKHLGIDSLGKVELFLRIQKEFKVQFSDAVLAECDTLEEILKAIKSGSSDVDHIDVSEIKHISFDKHNVKPDFAKTLVEVLLLYALQTPQRTHIFLYDELGNKKIITYGDLLENSKKIANAIMQYGIAPGETIAIMQPTNPGFFYTFFGILICGCIPVPIYPPLRPQQLENYIKQEANILRNAEARLLITFTEAKNLSYLLRTFIPSLKDIVTVDTLMQNKSEAAIFPSKKEDFALIQYTSGSTSDPKGVLLTHNNLLTNIRACGEVFKAREDDVIVSWVPLYHDLGLIGMWLGSFYYGLPLVLLSPITFLNRPEQWLWAIHANRGTISGGPNFAYELCVKKIQPEQIEGLDLSSWRVAVNGAEAILPATLKRFTEKFSPYGFEANTFFPLYGLAEATLCLTAPPIGRGPKIDRIERKAFEEKKLAVSNTSTDEKKYLEFIACGSPINGQNIRVVDENNNELPERHIGCLQFKGPSSMQGYYNNPKMTQEAYHDGWWESGDLAYIADKEVFIVGRIKDTIIKAGRNLSAVEIEKITGEISGVRKGCVIAFGATNHSRSTEKLVIVAETKERKIADKKKLKDQIREKIVDILDVVPDEIIMVPPRTIPKTSSGKLKRSACKQAYLQGELTSKKSLLWQGITLIAKSCLNIFNKILINLGKLLYTAYIAFLIFISMIILWFTSLISTRNIFVRFCKTYIKIMLWLGLCPVIVKGKDKLSNNKNKAIIYASNHASYIDGIVMLAVLPIETHIIAKKEVFNWPIIGTILRKLNCIPIDREDISQSLEDIETIKKLISENKPIHIFPEGTFGYAAGLRRFKLGAFKIASETNTPICPVALCGTRYILRAHEILMQPGVIKVLISQPILTKGTDWKSINKIKNDVRRIISETCGESTLDFMK